MTEDKYMNGQISITRPNTGDDDKIRMLFVWREEKQ